LHEIQAEFAERLFRSLDQDQNGFLQAEETRQLSTLAPFAALAAEEAQKTLDRDPQDGKISPLEFAAGIEAVGGATFALVAQPQRRSQEVDLFSRLDVDRDGRLTAEELQAGPLRLLKLDADDDETFSLNELLPFRNPLLPNLNAAEPAGTADLPFVALHPSASAAHAEELLKRYDRSEPSPKDARLSPAEIGVEAAEFAPFDTNADGGLEAAELARFLQSPVVAVELVLQLPRNKPGRPKLTRLVPPPGESSAASTERENRLTIPLGGADFEMRANSAALLVATDNRQFYKLRFRTVDQDKNQYLDEQEFGNIGGGLGSFQAVDRDGDGKIFEKELLASLDDAANSTPTRVFMNVAREGTSLFEILDVNRDFRLSARELVHGFQHLSPLDRDGDGVLTQLEFEGRYKVTYEIAKPPLLQNRVAPVEAQGASPRANESTSGPEWFRKMDRNRDGDVSRREFLGPSYLFDGFDDNGDDALDRTEAERLSASAAKK
jgi:Ca2+-binding EF-hand superfamily protein